MKQIDPSKILLFFEPKDRFRMTIEGDCSYITVRPAWASPLSHPKRFLALLDGKGDEIVTLDDPECLPPESWKAAQEELRRRYLTATVLRVDFAKVEFGATYWHVDTDRGTRDFVTQSLQENAQWLSDHHLLLIDVDGNRFEIPDIRRLDDRSQEFIHRIL